MGQILYAVALGLGHFVTPASVAYAVFFLTRSPILWECVHHWAKLAWRRARQSQLCARAIGEWVARLLTLDKRNDQGGQTSWTKEYDRLNQICLEGLCCNGDHDDLEETMIIVREHWREIVSVALFYVVLVCLAPTWFTNGRSTSALSGRDIAPARPEPPSYVELYLQAALSRRHDELGDELVDEGLPILDGLFPDVPFWP